MSYKVGISSGWWNFGKDPSLMGLALKAGGYGATAGVQFNQVDLDTILEFLEPRMKEIYQRNVRNLGIEVGLHGELGEIVAFESAQRRIWEQAHDRIATTLKYAADLKMIYVNIHLSNSIQLQQQERELRPFGFTYQVVDFFGRPFYQLAEDGTAGGNAVKQFIKRRLSVGGGMIREIQGEEIYRDRADKYSEELNREIANEALRRIRQRGQPETPDVVQGEFDRVHREYREHGILRERENEFLYSIWKDPACITAKYTLEAGEIDAYLAVGVYMYANHDPLWFSIVGDVHPETAYSTHPQEFNAAVAAKYFEGHIALKNHPVNRTILSGMSMQQWCEKNKVVFALEMPHTQQGTEGLNRFFHPLHSQHLIRKIGSPFVRLCIDFEQTIANRIDIDNELIPKLPKDFGKLIFLIHLGEPVPFWGTAHIPIALGGIGQEILYKWLFEFRKRGFDSGYLVFERGSGRAGQARGMYEVFENSVYVVRQIVKYLDQDVKPEDIPPEFYGLSTENKDFYARQYVTMRDHAWDPLEGLLRIPEERHTFLSRAAVEAGKREEWEKRKLR